LGSLLPETTILLIFSPSKVTSLLVSGDIPPRLRVPPSDLGVVDEIGLIDASYVLLDVISLFTLLDVDVTGFWRGAPSLGCLDFFLVLLNEEWLLDFDGGDAFKMCFSFVGFRVDKGMELLSIEYGDILFMERDKLLFGEFFSFL